MTTDWAQSPYAEDWRDEFEVVPLFIAGVDEKAGQDWIRANPGREYILYKPETREWKRLRAKAPVKKKRGRRTRKASK